ncbi:hypothetical protein AB0926_33230, partial [Streptomyces griseoincarnatus]
LPQPLTISTLNAHGPRNSHRSRVLRGPLEPKWGEGLGGAPTRFYCDPGIEGTHAKDGVEGQTGWRRPGFA